MSTLSEVREVYSSLETGRYYRDTEVCKLCNRSTRHGKPYCIEHLEHNEYAKVALKLVEQHEREKALLRARKILPKDAIIVADAIHLLKIQPWSVELLGKRMHLKGVARYTLARTLVHHGLVTSTPKRRGSPILKCAHPSI